MKSLILLIIAFWPCLIQADTTSITKISPKYCESSGPRFQPDGMFAIYVFCDDALGTNISIFINRIGNPFQGKWDLGKRFWQGEEWAYDVTSWSWLDKNQLLLATSNIYGSGSLYLLNLEKQESAVLFHLNGAVLEISKVGKDYVIVEYETELGEKKSVRVAM